MIKKAVSKDERAWFFSFKEKRAKTVSERIFHAGENSRVFVSTDLAEKMAGGIPVFRRDLSVSMPYIFCKQKKMGALL
jgi:hypothetical protein